MIFLLILALVIAIDVAFIFCQLWNKARDANTILVINKIDAIKQKEQLIDKACKCYCEILCGTGRSGMCFIKHDHNNQVKESFKYNDECNVFLLIRREMEDES